MRIVTFYLSTYSFRYSDIQEYLLWTNEFWQLDIPISESEAQRIWMIPSNLSSLLRWIWFWMGRFPEHSGCSWCDLPIAINGSRLRSSQSAISVPDPSLPSFELRNDSRVTALIRIANPCSHFLQAGTQHLILHIQLQLQFYRLSQSYSCINLNFNMVQIRISTAFILTAISLAPALAIPLPAGSDNGGQDSNDGWVHWYQWSVTDINDDFMLRHSPLAGASGLQWVYHIPSQWCVTNINDFTLLLSLPSDLLWVYV